ncbi:MAG: hypothetical protein OEM59_22695 [Rhodospirillales bacterium]|nr:hypothetical protein [Rhodospirillales bacterium]
MWHKVPAAAGLAAALMLSACGDGGEVSNLTFDDVRRAAVGDEAGFRQYFDGVKGQRVAWQGKVVEARREFGDDYAESGLLLVDMDGAGAEDVSFAIPPSKLADFQPGQDVRFTAFLREYELRKGTLLLKMEMKAVE